MLTLSASSDVTATTFGLSVNSVVWSLRILTIVAPFISGLIAYRLCRELLQREAATVAAAAAAQTASTDAPAAQTASTERV